MGKADPALTHRGFVTGRPSGSLQRELKARSPPGQGGCAAALSGSMYPPTDQLSAIYVRRSPRDPRTRLFGLVSMQGNHGAFDSFCEGDFMLICVRMNCVNGIPA